MNTVVVNTSKALSAEGAGKYRKLGGVALLCQRVMFLSLAGAGVLFILGLHTTLRWMLFREQYLGLFLALVLASVFLGVRPTKKSPIDRIGWYDIVLVVCGFAVGGYIMVFYPRIVITLGNITPANVVGGTLMLLLILEAVRRVVGWSVVVVVSCCVLYAHFKHLFPGLVGGQGVPWDLLMNYLYLDPNALFSMVAIAATIGLAFILFGQLLIASGGGKFFNDVAMVLTGRFRGGPGKAAVVGSSLVGTISGGPVTNVMLTGTITIPMMKNAGYTPTMAGAIEAVASTGGQIMPPVMGIAAFIIAEFLEIPYAKVALAAAIPAVLYYLTLFIQVDLEAGKNGLRALPAQMLPRLRSVVKMGWVVLPPVLVLIYTLFIIRLTPATAGVYSALAALAITPFLKENRPQFWNKLLRAVENNGRILLEIGVILAAAGFIVGTMGISGLGSTLSMVLVHIAGGNVLVLLLLAAITSMILGMGMPSVAAYILVAVLVAPALIQMGIPPLAAHLFIFYYAIICNITPPVAVAAFAAAGLAGSSPMRTGFLAFRLGFMAYIVPFLFIFSPVLILQGSPLQIVLISASVAGGCLVMGVALVGYFSYRVNWWQRLVLGLAAAALIIPLDVYLGNLVWSIKMLGAAIAVPVLFFNWRSGKGATGAAVGKLEDTNNYNV